MTSSESCLEGPSSERKKKSLRAESLQAKSLRAESLRAESLSAKSLPAESLWTKAFGQYPSREVFGQKFNAFGQ